MSSNQINSQIQTNNATPPQKTKNSQSAINRGDTMYSIFQNADTNLDDKITQQEAASFDESKCDEKQKSVIDSFLNFFGITKNNKKILAQKTMSEGKESKLKSKKIGITSKPEFNNNELDLNQDNLISTEEATTYFNKYKNDTSKSELCERLKDKFGIADGDFSTVTQGKTGDCWLVATAFSLSQTKNGQAILNNAVKQNDDGTITVTLLGAKSENGEPFTKTYTNIQLYSIKKDSDRANIELLKVETEYDKTKWQNKHKQTFSNDIDMIALECAFEDYIKQAKAQEADYNGQLKDINNEIDKVTNRGENDSRISSEDIDNIKSLNPEQLKLLKEHANGSNEISRNEYKEKFKNAGINENLIYRTLSEKQINDILNFSEETINSVKELDLQKAELTKNHKENDYPNYQYGKNNNFLKGGISINALAILTGKSSEDLKSLNTTSIEGFFPKTMFGETNFKIESSKKQEKKSDKEEKLITLSDGQSIYTTHGYSIVSVDNKNKTITLRNPHANNPKPDEKGDIKKDNTNNGIITIKMKDYKKYVADTTIIKIKDLE